MPTLDVTDVLFDPDFCDFNLWVTRRVQTVDEDGIGSNSEVKKQFAGVVTVDRSLENHRMQAGQVISGAILIVTTERLTEDDTEAIIHPCLAVVSRRHMDGWVPVFTKGELMFDDIDLLVMLQLVARVVADSLGNFLPTPLTSTTQSLQQG